MRPLKNALFYPISVSGSNFNPRNTQCMSVAKIFAFLDLEPRLNIKYGFNWAGKTEHFSKVSKLSVADCAESAVLQGACGSALQLRAPRLVSPANSTIPLFR